MESPRIGWTAEAGRAVERGVAHDVTGCPLNPRFGSIPDPEPEAHLPEPDPYAHWFEGITRGDSQAFEALFRALYDRLCGVAESYVGSAHVAEEVVDDVFLSLWKGRERLRVKTSVLNYLFVAVRNKSFTRLNRAKREQQFAERAQAEGADDAVNAAGEIEEQAATSDMVALVQEAVRHLPPRAQQTYVLYYHENLSYAQIANVMGVSVKTVENQLSRSLKILWLRLKDRLG